MSDEINAKVIAKIQKLFALASSPNEAEAKSAMEKAHALLSAYNLSMSDVKGTTETAVSSVDVPETREHLWRSSLFFSVCTFNFCAMVKIKGPGSAVTYQIFGREANVASTIAMHDYLVSCVLRLTKSAREVIGGFVPQDFKFGMVQRLGERMQEIRMAEKDEGCTALVVVDTEARDALHAKYPHLRPGRKPSTDPGSSSAALGRQSAESVALRKQIKD